MTRTDINHRQECKGPENPCSILIVSLAHDWERREKMVGNLARYSLQGRFLDAVDGSKLQLDLIPAYRPSCSVVHSGSYLSTNEVACYLSHLDALARAEQNELSLILEDDTYFSDELCAFLAQLQTSSWRAFDILRIGTRDNEPMIGRNCAPPIMGLPIVRLARRVAGAQAYIVTGESAARVRTFLSRRIIRPIDTELIRDWAHGFRIYGTGRCLVFHDDAQPSRIGARGKKSPSQGGRSRTLTFRILRLVRGPTHLAEDLWYRWHQIQIRLLDFFQSRNGK